MLEAIIAEADLVHTHAIEGDRDAIETNGLHLTRKAAEKLVEKIAESYRVSDKQPHSEAPKPPALRRASATPGKRPEHINKLSRK